MNVTQPAPLYQTWHVLSQGMQNNHMRALIASQNFANADSVGRTPEEEPYKRQMIEIEAQKDRQGVMMPKIRSITNDPSPPRMVYKPGHPAANDKGLLKMPHINTHLELADFQEANTASMGCAKLYALNTEMMSRTHSLMKGI